MVRKPGCSVTVPPTTLNQGRPTTAGRPAYSPNLLDPRLAQMVALRDARPLPAGTSIASKQMLGIRCGLRELAVNLRRDPFNLGLAATCYHGLSLRDSVVLRGELWTAEPNSASSSLKASFGLSQT